MLLNSLPDGNIVLKSGSYKRMSGDSVVTLKEYAKTNKIRFITRQVLAKNLRDRTDLHGRPYQPHTYIFFNVNDLELWELKKNLPVKEITPLMQTRAYKKELAHNKKFGYGV
jgi:hypothetical protein